ncbi:TPA: 23S rRNA pseudouridine synthase F [Candidatus Nomurabacteria bacterium]|nr:MAG: Pseudouridine synthase [Candidatus Nomurabacteria bacterium GW2011_GWE2_36_115]KKP94314.1 MAG: Pseudouridine synthase [Candidatus Nomurabacteria bacterium GW2011_GWF2_36_126]KKP96859.1 MAG: Pseudouridine synthase [Candidatus Nomurabacteria bacterium GW2011_GWD2_36_14]KKP99537.1 MAG: Pseudouridine synthase [Candidatus Nomurabacteria bacterium GW2011_GWF2_36_19]KKQ05532.1 MAG: Pseudouridine synthase [Candidatus Nomurabacteria bacterium GW2011_GWF1_36_47]KKQ09784.1 MAG: Pseudouridine synt
MEYPIRINKYLALKNYATRKGADELIKKGFVFINGRKAVLGDQVYRDEDVTVSDKVPKKDYVYYAYNKAVGVSTNPDVKTKDILKVTKFKEAVFPIGRLDKDSRGLILMTNDGRVTDRLLSPLYVHEKEYVVKVEPNFSDKFIELMGGGVHFDKFISRKCKVWRNTAKSKDTFNIVLTEGKKRQIRRMCEALHHKVVDLKRIRIMNIELGKLNEGEYRDIKGAELDTLLKSLKLR